MKTYVILHDIRSAHNVGSIFRTADGAGVSKIFLSGYTPTPIDRFGRVQLEIRKTSLGAIESVEWEVAEDVHVLIATLQKNGCEVVAVEQHKSSESLKDFVQKEDTAFIFGNEVEGVPEVLIESADRSVEIPMAGKKESLNVSVTAGVVLFHQSLSIRRHQ